MDQTTFFNLFLIFVLVVIVYTVISVVSQKQRLKKRGIETDGYILRWRQDRVRHSVASLSQSISTPTIQFTTIDGRQITGEPVVGISDSEEYVNVWIRIVYNPDNPEEFMIKTWE